MAIICWKQAESRRFADLGTRIVGLMFFFGGEITYYGIPLPP